jgi:glycosyltransferase involved in cell wall biosynthesis
MSKSFLDYFKCPAEFVSITLAGEPSGDPGFFRFGNDLICFGQASLKKQSRSPRGALAQVGDPVEIRGRQVYLPFDLDAIISNLRLEIYSGNLSEQKTRLGAASIIHDLYYLVRPILPLSIRSALQRVKLKNAMLNPFPRWPVDRTVDRVFEKTMIAVIRANGGQAIPFIWFWPEGKQAASILTHDVEDEAGKAFCQSLMDIDDEYGFKASFQIVPEKRYSVEPEFLQQLRERNFEICVHDLNHDGNLYEDRTEFRRRAQIINTYCNKFGTEGFRSGVLYRNLLWYGDYQFSYDMSLPNVAHLDPQGGGCCTVMPYFVDKILEIPVNATQDYSLFHILHEHSIDLWKQQIRTIVDGHGLISFIIHPDYVIEKDHQQIYRQLLSYLREQCAIHKIWVTVPSQINSWWRQRSAMKLLRNSYGWRITGEGSQRARIAYATLVGDSLVYSFEEPPGIDHEVSAELDDFRRPLAVPSLQEIPAHSPTTRPVTQALNTPSTATAVLAQADGGTQQLTQEPSPRRPLRIAMVSYSFYELDNRVLRYASTLARRGDHVDVFALRREGKPAEEEIDGVHVHRLQGRLLNEKNRVSYAWRICQFLLKATLQVANHDVKNPYDLLHIHSVPDFMVFSALAPRLRGTPVILDIHDILPEFYASKFAAGKKTALFRALVRVERASARFASHVIIANDIWRERLISRGLSPDKCTVVLNSPDRSIFSRTGHRHSQKSKFLMLYPGTLNQHQGLDIAIRAFAKISRKAPQAEFRIYGDGPSKGELVNLVRQLGVESQVLMLPLSPIQEIARVMETANLGIVPKRKDNFGNEAFSTKILEFMAMGVPVIVSDTMIDKFYFNDSIVKFFRSGDEDDLARCILEMIENPKAREHLVANANRFVETVDWTAKQHEYLDLVDTLAGELRS